MSFCSKCGTELQNDVKFCPNCGTENNDFITSEVATTSTSQNNNQEVEVSPKSKTVTLLLLVFFGFFGIYDFYLGKWFLGVIKIILLVVGFMTAGLTDLPVFIWLVIDFIQICRNKCKDSKGLLITSKKNK